MFATTYSKASDKRGVVLKLILQRNWSQFVLGILLYIENRFIFMQALKYFMKNNTNITVKETVIAFVAVRF